MSSSAQLKAKKLLVALMLTSCISFGQSLRYDTIRYAREHYCQRINDFKKEPAKRGRIVFLGNSITEFGNWKNRLQDSSVINRGIAGDNTFGILDRLDEIIDREPSKLFVEAGINDISQNIPIDTIAENLFKMVRRVKAKSPQTELYIYGVLPTNEDAKKEYPDAYNKSHIAKSLNRKVQNGAKENKFTYIDLTQLFSDNNGQLNKKFAEADGLHLNHNGYEAWINFLRKNGYVK